MATPVQDKFLQTSSSVAKNSLALIGDLTRVNALYNGATNFKAAINQASLDANPAYAGFTKQQLDDAENVLAILLSTLNGGALPALEMLASLY